MIGDYAQRRRNEKLAQIASIAEAEALGSLNFRAHVGLLAFGAAAAWVLFDLRWLAPMALVYVGLLTAEKRVAGAALTHGRDTWYLPVLALLAARSTAFMAMVLALWSQEGDIYKVASLALITVGAINLFVFHSGHRAVIATVIAPISLCFGVLAWMIYRDYGPSDDALAALLIFVCVSPYFYLTLMQAHRQRTELTDTRLALEQSQRLDALGKLSTGVAHDFNNVLAVTLGNAELLKTASDGETDRLADEIIKAAERGASLSGQLLTFGRRETVPRARQAHRISDSLDDLAEMLRRVLPVHIELVLSATADAPDVQVDRHQLETALLNLAVNARDAMPKGGKLTIRATRLRLQPDDTRWTGVSKTGEDFGCIRVTDTGVGVPEALQDRLFDAFFTTKAPGAGTGLGLSMVKTFAEQAGGAVRLESAPGRGTTVSLMLPAAARDPETEPATEQALGKAEKRARVLLVEDETPLLERFSRQLKRAGFDVTTAGNGVEAETILSVGMRPDVLVTDLAMPGPVQGLDLARRARQRIARLPVVVVTGTSAATLANVDEMEQAVTLLRKPVRSDQLVRAVRETLAGSF